ncbi:MAG: hypothetical protein GAK38_03546 [Xylophilus sp.]|nr:MAG: hypothetical protein GAK38_03546 [Xylophilus sp.]
MSAARPCPFALMNTAAAPAGLAARAAGTTKTTTTIKD